MQFFIISTLSERIRCAEEPGAEGELVLRDRRQPVEERPELQEERLQRPQELLELAATRIGKLEVGREEKAAELRHRRGRGEMKLDAGEGASPTSVLTDERGFDPSDASLSLEKLRLGYELDSKLQPLPPIVDPIGVYAGARLGDVADDSEGGRNALALVHRERHDASRTNAREIPFLGRRG
jgi:hypothetical protein